MPPRKRARLSQATSPSPSASRLKTPETADSASSPSKPTEPTDDPWSDHEEIGLFKGLMMWKPTGLHKHFRLLALHSWLLENGYIHPKSQHTRPAGIRAKLETLYNMDALDAREDARQLPALDLPDAEPTDPKGTVLDDDIYSEADNRIEADDFALPPEAGFEKAMWNRRLPAQSGDESDAELPELNLDKEPPVRFVATVSIEPSEAATPGSRKGKGAGSARRKSVPKIGTVTRRSARQAESTADEDEAGKDEAGKDEEKEDEEKEDEQGEDEEEEIENSDSEDQSQQSTPAPRSTRTSKGTRGRGRPRGRARGRK